MEYWTSDTHFGHYRIISAHNRPFRCVEEMDEVMVENINKTVKKTDTLYHLGDFAVGSVEYAIKIRKKINCENLFLVYGNHDEKNRVFKEFRRAFGRGKCHDIFEIKRGGRLLVMCHYPMLFCHHWDKGAWMIHGHMHCEFSPLREHNLILDVGVDGHDFMPWSYDEIVAYMTPRVVKYNEVEISEKTMYTA